MTQARTHTCMWVLPTPANGVDSVLRQPRRGSIAPLLNKRGGDSVPLCKITPPIRSHTAPRGRLCCTLHIAARHRGGPLQLTAATTRLPHTFGRDAATAPLVLHQPAPSSQHAALRPAPSPCHHHMARPYPSRSATTHVPGMRRRPKDQPPQHQGVLVLLLLACTSIAAWRPVPP